MRNDILSGADDGERLRSSGRRHPCRGATVGKAGRDFPQPRPPPGGGPTAGHVDGRTSHGRTKTFERMGPPRCSRLVSRGGRRLCQRRQFRPSQQVRDSARHGRREEAHFRASGSRREHARHGRQFVSARHDRRGRTCHESQAGRLRDRAEPFEAGNVQATGRDRRGVLLEAAEQPVQDPAAGRRQTEQCSRPVNGSGPPTPRRTSISRDCASMQAPAYNTSRLQLPVGSGRLLQVYGLGILPRKSFQEQSE